MTVFVYVRYSMHTLTLSEKQNISEFWKHLKHVTYDKKSKSMLPNVLTFNGESITDKKCIADKLNDHFVNIAGFMNKINFNEECFLLSRNM